MGIFREFWEFIRERKKFWILPILLVLLLVLALVVSAKGSAIAPFIYALF